MDGDHAVHRHHVLITAFASDRGAAMGADRLDEIGQLAMLMMAGMLFG